MSESRLSPVASQDNSVGPSFLVGQDAEGHWLAIERHGRGGGIFVSKDAALRYVGFETAHAPGTCQLVEEPVGLFVAGTAPAALRRAA